jgi:hypothetical protein
VPGISLHACSVKTDDSTERMAARVTAYSYDRVDSFRVSWNIESIEFGKRATRVGSLLDDTSRDIKCLAKERLRKSVCSIRVHVPTKRHASDVRIILPIFETSGKKCIMAMHTKACTRVRMSSHGLSTNVCHSRPLYHRQRVSPSHTFVRLGICAAAMIIERPCYINPTIPVSGANRTSLASLKSTQRFLIKLRTNNSNSCIYSWSSIVVASQNIRYNITCAGAF